MAISGSALRASDLSLWLTTRGGLKVKVFITQLCLTLCNPMDSSPPGSSVYGILQARILEWVAMPTSRGSPRPQGSNLCLLRLLALTGRFFTTEPPLDFVFSLVLIPPS